MTFQNVKSLKNIISGYFDGNPLIGQLLWMDPAEWIAVTGRKYINVNAYYSGSVLSLSSKTIAHTFTMSVSDRMDKENIDSENDIYSQCADVISLFLGWLANYSTDISVIDGIQYSTFREDSGDFTAGIATAFSISVPASINPCDTPS